MHSKTQSGHAHRRRLLVAAVLAALVGVIGALVTEPGSVRARSGYGGGGGYQQCGRGCQVGKCRKQCGKAKRTCVFCARADKKTARAACVATAGQSLTACNGSCKPDVKKALRACRGAATASYNAAKGQCGGLTGTCKGCCGENYSGGCGGTFRGTDGYGTSFRKITRYGKVKTYRPDCSVTTGGSPNPGDPRCQTVCERLRQRQLATCKGGGKDDSCTQQADAAYQACIAQCGGGTTFTTTSTTTTFTAPTITTTTTTPLVNTCEFAGWGCCKLSPTAATCAEEFGGDETELTGAQVYCGQIGGTWAPGRCADPLCGRALGCCVGAAFSRYACEQGYFGAGVPDLAQQCAFRFGTFVAERCVEPEDPCPPGSPADCCRSDGGCDDGKACNGIETCVQNRCQHGTPVDCSFGNHCTEYHCQELGGANATCTPADVSPACDDGDGCNGYETPDCSTGACTPGQPLNCDQSDDFCTDYQCVSSNNYAQCTAHSLAHETCDDGNGCNGSETFNCSTGQCEQGPPYDCNQYDTFCFNYECASFGGYPQCLTTEIPHADCDDGDACNGHESFDCDQGSCKDDPDVVCPSGMHCVSTDNSASCVADE